MLSWTCENSIASPHCYCWRRVTRYPRPRYRYLALPHRITLANISLNTTSSRELYLPSFLPAHLTEVIVLCLTTGLPASIYLVNNDSYEFHNSYGLLDSLCRFDCLTHGPLLAFIKIEIIEISSNC